MDELRYGKTTGLLIQAFYDVYNKLGYGFLERVYQNSMAIAARRLGLNIKNKHDIEVYFEGQVVGEYEADLIADDAVIVELKAGRALAPEHEAQLLNYLKATHYEVGLVFNFGVQAEYRRKILDNSRKGDLSWLKK